MGIEKKLSPAQLINQSSGDYEYYTPPEIVEAARRTMGGIDLDPASSAKANSWIKATDYLTEKIDGLTQMWYGRVWLNHPFGRESNPKWISKLLTEYRGGHVKQACCITYACTSEAWFRPLFAYPMCFLSPRTNYFLPDGSLKKGVTKGSVVTYLGPKWSNELFFEQFGGLGSLTQPFL